MDKKPRKFYWHANVSSGGTLSLMIDLDGEFSKEEKVDTLAESLKNCYEFMKERGYIPYNAQLLSSGDIAEQYGKSRQYWEKLLNEGKILYKETSAGRITTDLWIRGYLDNKDEVNKYVKNVREVIHTIENLKEKTFRPITCPVCNTERFRYSVNKGRNINGICDECGFHIHTTT